MKFNTLNNEFEFTIESEWLKEGMQKWSPTNQISFKCSKTQGMFITNVKEIFPRRRKNNKFWFRNKGSVVDILNAFREQRLMPPIEVTTENVPKGYKYDIKDGFHRYYLSIAVGFKEIPCVINNFDINKF